MWQCNTNHRNEGWSILYGRLYTQQRDINLLEFPFWAQVSETKQKFGVHWESILSQCQTMQYEANYDEIGKGCMEAREKPIKVFG